MSAIRVGEFCRVNAKQLSVDGQLSYVMSVNNGEARITVYRDDAELDREIIIPVTALTFEPRSEAISVLCRAKRLVVLANGEVAKIESVDSGCHCSCVGRDGVLTKITVRAECISRAATHAETQEYYAAIKPKQTCRYKVGDLAVHKPSGWLARVCALGADSYSVHFLTVTPQQARYSNVHVSLLLPVSVNDAEGLLRSEWSAGALSYTAVYVLLNDGTAARVIGWDATAGTTGAWAVIAAGSSLGSEVTWVSTKDITRALTQAECSTIPRDSDVLFFSASRLRYVLLDNTVVEVIKCHDMPGEVTVRTLDGVTSWAVNLNTRGIPLSRTEALAHLARTGAKFFMTSDGTLPKYLRGALVTIIEYIPGKFGAELVLDTSRGQNITWDQVLRPATAKEAEAYVRQLARQQMNNDTKAKAVEALTTIKDDGKEAMKRLAATNVVKLTKGPIIAFLAASVVQIEGDEPSAEEATRITATRKAIAAFLRTPHGEAFFAYALALCWPLVRGLMPVNSTALEVGDVLAKELRVQAMTIFGAPIADVVMSTLVPVLNQQAALLGMAVFSSKPEAPTGVRAVVETSAPALSDVEVPTQHAVKLAAKLTS